MEQYIIKGGNPLVGEVEIGGAKNAALAILAAAIMTDETVLIDNLPDVNDVNVMLEAISGIGAMVQRIDRHTVKINGSTIGDFNIEYDYIKKIRASYYLLGALLGKYKKAEVALPGGCNIGSRPIDQHLKGFRALGADVDIEHGKIVAEAEHLRGTHLYFDVVSVGATINVMMTAAMAEGLTIMENVAKEPHVVDVANFLNSMGANIRGAGTDVIKIRGVKSLHKSEYSIIPDQIEAGTFMFAAAATKGDVTVMNVIPKHLDATISKLVDIGCEVEEFDDAVRVVSKGRLKSTHVKTLPYPGFPTDMQPQITVTLGLSQGTSIVTESIFENRFKYVDELTRMGASIKVEGNTAIIDGVSRYTGAGITAPDLRAGAALVIAALAAEGVSTVDDIRYIERGYENFPEKLRGLGAQIEKVDNERDVKNTLISIATYAKALRSEGANLYSFVEDMDAVGIGIIEAALCSANITENSLRSYWGESLYTFVNTSNVFDPLVEALQKTHSATMDVRSIIVCAHSALSLAIPGLFLSPNQKLFDKALHNHEAISFFERHPLSYNIIRESITL